MSYMRKLEHNCLPSMTRPHERARTHAHGCESAAPTSFVDYEGYQGCGWCNVTKTCLAGTWEKSFPIEIPGSGLNAEPVILPPCMGEVNMRRAHNVCKHIMIEQPIVLKTRKMCLSQH